ncbi:hypothetical protein K7G98_33820, partial [Saccharothrix sp. MB29]|nr:hypothetical protein [Saccharothrix sp. MB29]
TASITPSLDPKSRVSGNPYRLEACAGASFQGCIILGKGFIIDAAWALRLVGDDERNGDVLFPYLNGDDLNSRPDCSASRWVVDFNDRPIEWAQKYEDVFSIVD